MNEPIYLMGIDPSVQNNNGYCIYNSKTKQFIIISTTSPYSIIGNIYDAVAKYGADKIVIVVENSDLNKVVWGNGGFGKFKKLIGQHMRFPIWSTLQVEFGKSMTYARSVGKNQQFSKTIVETAKRIEGLRVIEIAPSWRDRADKNICRGSLQTNRIQSYTLPTKTTAAQFQSLTGIKATDIKTTEHARDSATLVYNQTYKSLTGLANRKKLADLQNANTRKRGRKSANAQWKKKLKL